jgi:hypothetical protein
VNYSTHKHFSQSFCPSTFKNLELKGKNKFQPVSKPVIFKPTRSKTGLKMKMAVPQERHGTIEECKLIGAEYVQRVVDALNNRFLDLGIFNACKFFSPNLYPANDDERTRITEEWLERLFVKFQTFEEKQDRCQGECLEMLETMGEMIPNKSLFEAWEFISTTP